MLIFNLFIFQIILTSASVLNIDPGNFGIHQISAVGVASASGTPIANEIGVTVGCKISDYLSKDKLIELDVTLFYPNGGRFTNQTMSIKDGSSIFFSGSLTLIEDKIYLELQNFSFIRNNNTPTTTTKKTLPWSQKSDSPTLTSTNAARLHDLLSKKSSTLTPVSPLLKQQSTPIPADKNPPTTPTPTNKNLPTPPTTGRRTRSQKLTNTANSDSDNDEVKEVDADKNQLKSSKRKTRSNKKQKLADIATEIVSVFSDEDA